MFARSLTRRFRTIAFYRDEIAIVALGLAHQALVAGVTVPGFTVAMERDMIVRIADVHAAPAVHVQPAISYDAQSHRMTAPSAVTFQMPTLPVPELQATRVMRHMPVHGANFRLITPGIAPKARIAPAVPTTDVSETALRAAVERARVEARVRAAVARALAAEQASRRVSGDDVN